MFDRAEPSPPDLLFGMMKKIREDKRPGKIDVGLGIYRDGSGQSPIMRAVAAAQQHLLQTETTKGYIGMRGQIAFLDAMQALVFAKDMPPYLCSVQGLGGTGAIRLAIELIARVNPKAAVHVGLPTWPLHTSIPEAAKLAVQTHRFFNARTQRVCTDEIFDAVDAAQAGDVFITQGPAHNPTGTDMPIDAQFALYDKMAERGVIPLIDSAYYGLSTALEDDLAHLRGLLARVPRALLALSCSKTFGLYRERVGVLFVKSAHQREADAALDSLVSIGRSAYSMAPSYGAALIAHVLNTPELKADWCAELDTMRARIDSIRSALAKGANQCPPLAKVGAQRGIFSLLPIDQAIVEQLADDHAVYMSLTGRINVAGLKDKDIAPFIEHLSQVAG
ncbi:MAG: aromatic amino acid transaminase [Pseudomonadota bacterium]